MAQLAMPVEIPFMAVQAAAAEIAVLFDLAALALMAVMVAMAEERALEQ